MRGLGVQPHMGVLPESSCEGVGLGSGLSPASLVSEAPRLWASAWEQGEGCPGQTPPRGSGDWIWGDGRLACTQLTAVFCPHRSPLLFLSGCWPVSGPVGPAGWGSCSSCLSSSVMPSRGPLMAVMGYKLTTHFSLLWRPALLASHLVSRAVVVTARWFVRKALSYLYIRVDFQGLSLVPPRRVVA